jgi:hypothetical protein
MTIFPIGRRTAGFLIAFGISLPLVVLSRVLMPGLDDRSGILGLLADLVGKRAVFDEYFPMAEFLEPAIVDWILINGLVMLVIHFIMRRR